MVSLIAHGLASVCTVGILASGISLVLAVRFRRRAVAPLHRPPVSILKPLCGEEPSLEEALASFGNLDYPDFQLVIGVQDPADAALVAVDRMRRRFPGLDMVVVSDCRIHGANRKVSNLINMLPAARHDMLVFSDSDLHVAPDYLDHLMAAFERPGCGLVTTVCTGRVAGPALLAARLGAMQIGRCFLPGVLLSRWLGREDALGTTMALHRHTLARAGGLGRLLPHLADDHVLGRRVRALGLSIELAATIPVTTVAEASCSALWRHELRWARTIRALEPLPFLLSIAQFPLFWALAACLASGGTVWALALFGACWIGRVACARGIDHGLRVAPGDWREGLLWPVRELLSAALVVASFCGNRVVWRGQVMRADSGLADQSAVLRYVVVPD